MSKLSSSTTGSRSVSVTSGSSTTSTIFSQTFSSDTASPTGPSNSGSGNNNPNSNAGNPNDNNLQSSASLYLYTFLATLVLLLGVSAAIVFRSLLLRRRHRRMIEEAIRNGTWIPPAAGRRIDPSKKPKLFEAHLAAPPTHGPSFDTQEWDGIMPFSVTYATPPTAGISTALDEQNNDTASANLQGGLMASRMRSTWRRFLGNSPASPSSSAPIIPLSNVPSTTRSTPATPNGHDTPAIPPVPSPAPSLRIAVLIAMPSPTPLQAAIQHSQDLEEDELPHIEFGVAEIDVQEEHANRTLEQAERKRSTASSEI